MTQEIKNENARLLEKLSLYLNLMPASIDKSMVDELSKGSCDKKQREYALSALLCAYCGFDADFDEKDRLLFHSRFLKMVHIESKEDFTQNPYYKNIKIPNVTRGDWELCTQSFKAYEAFVADELTVNKNGEILPNIGFFESEFCFPAAKQKGREWMTITPHEIRTTQKAVDLSKGKVATYGLGLGYYAYMASLKENVESVTVVELDSNILDLFKEHILPQFPNKEKIELVCANAFEYAKTQAPRKNFDFVFADTWHDPSDGIDMYNSFKALEHLCPNTKMCYWIESTLKYYMENTNE